MTTRKGNEILVRLFDGAKTLPKVGNCPFLEGDDRGHGRQDNSEAVNFLLKQPGVARKTKAAAPFEHRRH